MAVMFKSLSQNGYGTCLPKITRTVLQGLSQDVQSLALFNEKRICEKSEFKRTLALFNEKRICEKSEFKRTPKFEPRWP